MSSSSRPNFLLIVADDLGFSDLGAFGGEIQTPALDKLAFDGVRFNQFYAAAACSPTRSMLLSGTDNHIAGLGEMFEYIERRKTLRGKPGHEGVLNDKVAALPEILKDGGYATIISGKWHLGMLPDLLPAKRGFEKSYALLPGCANHYGWEPQLEDEGEGSSTNFLKSAAPALHSEGEQYQADLPENYYSSDFYASKLIEYLDEHRDSNKNRSPELPEKPFFAYLPFTAPHWPLQAPREIIEKYKGTYDEGPEVLRERRLQRQKELGLIPANVEAHPVVAPEYTAWDKLDDDKKAKSARAMETYAAMVDRLDWNVGRVVEDLKKNGEFENTVIIFISDNGAEGASLEAIPLIGPSIEAHIAKYYNNSLENIGNKDSYVWYGPRWAQAATAPTKLYKTFTSEGGIHVPFILHYPEISNSLKGQISNVFSTVMDIAPTFLDLAGIPQPDVNDFHGRQVAPMRGKSWVPFLSNPTETERVHNSDDTTGWGLFGNGALRKGDWKITYLYFNGDNTWRLYNLKEDPAEIHDVSEKYPEKFKELLEGWEDYKRDYQVLGLGNDYDDLPLNEIDDETVWMKYERANAYYLKRQVEKGETIPA